MSGIMRAPTQYDTHIYTLRSKVAERAKCASILVANTKTGNVDLAFWTGSTWDTDSGETGLASSYISSVEESVSGDTITYTVKHMVMSDISYNGKACFLPPQSDKSSINWASPTERRVK